MQSSGSLFNKVLFKKLLWPALLEEGAICVSLQVCVSRDTFREITSRRFALHCVAKVRAICVMVGVLIDVQRRIWLPVLIALMELSHDLVLHDLIFCIHGSKISRDVEVP